MRYQALSSESLNSKTPPPMDFMGLTSNLGGRPCCISRKEVPKSKRMDFGHDFRMSHGVALPLYGRHSRVFTLRHLSRYRNISIIAIALLRATHQNPGSSETARNTEPWISHRNGRTGPSSPRMRCWRHLTAQKGPVSHPRRQ
jgi:hypothetical protein